LPRNQDEAWIVDTVGRLAAKAGLPMPEVAVYEGAPNAFATGPSKSNSLLKSCSASWPASWSCTFRAGGNTGRTQALPR
jgi:Zn-dependent protease with chaperone function